MKKQYKSILSFFFGVFLIMSSTVFALACEPSQIDETQPDTPEARELHIRTEEDFLEFARNARLDSYSWNLSVFLDADLDLTDMAFSGIPIFCGNFEGNYHTIQGISLHTEGSVQGLFRYLTDSACVRNLTVQGAILPEGSHATVGGLAGQNAGTIERCSFEGRISGSSQVGGIAGVNMLTGIIEECSMDGNVHGTHFAGGLTGKNYGLVRKCTNSAEINTTPMENEVDFSDITLGTLTGSESAKTVTDIGGIVGINSGVVRDCKNYGNVGYQKMGYNIGGIAGNHQGYLAGCENHGNINGRKEVGGIIGQMEPVSELIYHEDTLQMLQQQIRDMSVLTEQASGNMHGNTAQIKGQIDQLQGQTQTAQEALQQLIISPENPPDADSLLAALNTLSSSMSGMRGSIERITAASRNAVGTASRDFQKISDQMNEINKTVNQASQNLGGSISDISDQDTEDNLTGKTEHCINYGAVRGDFNTGGIVGAMVWENDLDAENDFYVVGDNSFNFVGEFRAVVLECENKAEITAGKRNAGGIAGWMPMGLVKHCMNTGTVDGEDGEYIGGIAGSSSGFIRGCDAKAELTGSEYIGGIAGCASVVSDCRSMVKITNGDEKLGAILGGAAEHDNADESHPLCNNTYLVTDVDLGGIDGISYAGAAEPVEKELFLNDESIPDFFRGATVTFMGESGACETIFIETGEALDVSVIPQVPRKQSYNGKWAGLENVDLSEIYFDVTLQASYMPWPKTIQSDVYRENNMPLLLAEGQFGDMTVIEMEQISTDQEIAVDETIVECWSIPDFSADENIRLRFAYPKTYDPRQLKMLVRNTQGIWNAVDYEEDGSYLVFSVKPETNALCLVLKPKDYQGLFCGLGGAVVLSMLIVMAVHFYRRKKKMPSKKNHQ